MIALIREPEPRRSKSPAGLTTARRAIAALLFRKTAPQSAASNVSHLAAWAFVAWTVAIVISYVALFNVWRVRGD